MCLCLYVAWPTCSMTLPYVLPMGSSCGCALLVDVRFLRGFAVRRRKRVCVAVACVRLRRLLPAAGAATSSGRRGDGLGILAPGTAGHQVQAPLRSIHDLTLCRRQRALPARC